MATKARKPRPNVWDSNYKPYGVPPAGVKGDPDSWAEAFRSRIGDNAAVIEEILGDDDPWAILGISKGASADEVKSAYRKRARQTHPDVGGTEAEFNKVNAAYERLGGK
jgi:hypothetical protein